MKNYKMDKTDVQYIFLPSKSIKLTVNYICQSDWFIFWCLILLVNRFFFYVRFPINNLVHSYCTTDNTHLPQTTV